jgi:two-component system aerobic respiration control sensor histidine kinase ArcB
VFKQRETLSFTEIEKRPSDLKSLALKVIDWNASLKLVNEDENLLHELVDIVNLDLKMCQQTLSKAYSIHDDEALRKELHRVRGGICYLSLPQLDSALSHFHEAVKANPQSDDELEKSYGEVQYAMNAFWEAYEKLH